MSAPLLKVENLIFAREAVQAEAGDLIRPLMNGIIHADHIHSELGESLLKRILPKRQKKR